MEEAWDALGAAGGRALAKKRLKRQHCCWRLKKAGFTSLPNLFE